MTMTAKQTLAIDGGTKTRTTPWHPWPVWDATEERALLEVLHSGQWWSVGGAKVPEFEEAFARFQQARHCVAVTNGTAALEVCLRALGIGCGDEVIVPPYTFIATASSVLAVSATPVLRLMHCTAAPDAPLPRLSSEATARICSSASLP